jgi:hypothetical protein
VDARLERRGRRRSRHRNAGAARAGPHCAREAARPPLRRGRGSRRPPTGRDLVGRHYEHRSPTCRSTRPRRGSSSRTT